MDNFKMNFEGYLEGQYDFNISTTSRTKSIQQQGQHQEQHKEKHQGQHQEQNQVQHQNNFNTVGCDFIVISLVPAFMESRKKHKNEKTVLCFIFILTQLCIDKK